MISSPTIPPWAARVWIEGGKIHMDLPACGSALSHRLTIPDDAHGVSRMMHMIRLRNAVSRIGEAGDLTQHQMDHQIKEDLRKQGLIAVGEINRRPGGITRVKKDRFSPELRAGARAVLRGLGLIGAVRR